MKEGQKRMAKLNCKRSEMKEANQESCKEVRCSVLSEVVERPVRNAAVNISDA